MRRNYLITIYAATLIGFLAGTAVAATYTVTKTVDTNDGVCNSDCSLREAVIASNATPGADTINIGAGTYILSLVGASEDNSATGDLDIRGDVVINGAGSSQTIIDGGGRDRVFDVIANVSVEIKNLSIVNGLAMSDPGAGLYNEGNTTVKNVRFEGNVSDVSGGAIEHPKLFGTANHLTIDSSYFTNNCSLSGGAVESSSDLTIVNSVFDANVPVVKGGYDCPNGDGAAIQVQDGTATIDKSTFVNNVGDVGAISGWVGKLTITNTTIANNRGLGRSINIHNPTGPGGVSPQSSIIITIVNSTIANNTAAQSGGGVEGAVRLTNSIVANNTAASGPDCYGNVLSNGNNIFGTVAGCSVGLNASDLVVNPALGTMVTDPGTGQRYLPLLAGSPAIAAGSSAVCPSVDQIGNTRPVDGSGKKACSIGAAEFAIPVQATVCPAGCPHSSIQTAVNAAVPGATITIGPGVYRGNVLINKSVTLKSVAGADRTVLDAAGLGNPAVTITQFTTAATIDGFTITGGNASNGAGVSITDASATLRNNIIKNNAATNTGGGIYFSANFSQLIVENNLFESNSAASRGGAVVLSSYSYQAVKGNTFKNNSAASGGAIAAAMYGNENIMNNLFINNQNTIALPNYATTTLSNNTIVGSTGYTVRKGTEGPSITMINSIFWNNALNVGGFGLSTQHSLNGVDPMFVNATSGDYHLRAGSPAIDTGENTSPLGVLTDLAGVSRPQDGDGLGAGNTGDGSDYDIGAYEFRR